MSGYSTCPPALFAESVGGESTYEAPTVELVEVQYDNKTVKDLVSEIRYISERLDEVNKKRANLQAFVIFAAICVVVCIYTLFLTSSIALSQSNANGSTSSHNKHHIADLRDQMDAMWELETMRCVEQYSDMLFDDYGIDVSTYVHDDQYVYYDTEPDSDVYNLRGTLLGAGVTASCAELVAGYIANA